MENHRPAADRIRNVLAAMERSIDSARRKRVTGSDVIAIAPVAATPSAPTAPAPASIPMLAPVHSQPAAAAGSNQIARLKAKPKRAAMPFEPSFEPPAYRSQAS